MDPAFHSVFLDCLRSSDPSPDVKRLAAKGVLAPRALDQLGALMWLSDDPDPEVAASARATLDELPPPRLSAFLARPDVPEPVRAFFARRGVTPGPIPSPEPDPEPFQVREAVPNDVVQAVEDAVVAASDPERLERVSVMQRIASMTVPERLAVAMKGSREVRAILIRDPNKLVSTAVISSPKVTESEVESIARMTNVAEEILRIIANNRAWTKNYAVVAALTKNPKTPVALAMNLLSRLNERDLKGLATNRNVTDVVRMNARRRLTTDKS